MITKRTLVQSLSAFQKCNLINDVYNFKMNYNLGQISSDKREQICSYIIYHVDPISKMFVFSIKGLANKFKCSKMTVRRALNILSKAPYTKVTSNSIQYIMPKNKGGKKHGNK